MWHVGEKREIHAGVLSENPKINDHLKNQACMADVKETVSEHTENMNWVGCPEHSNDTDQRWAVLNMAMIVTSSGLS
jgi:hypothetical protein